jgi:large subunit ribosomal protein L32
MPSFTKCPNCQTEILPHHICPVCGYYKGRQVIVKKEKKEKRKA